ncbi:MAG: metallophosphoesterase, partial [Bacteroidia bacterium]
MNKTEVAKQYRDKFGSKIATLTLAKTMYKENVELFNNVEDARATLRYIEGKIGAKNRKSIPKESKYLINEERPKNPYKLPESDETEFKPYVIKGVNKLGILSDIHIPYHSIEAITAALDHFKKNGVDGIYLNGDLIDFYQLSRFQKDPRERSAAYELKATNDFLDSLQAAFPKAKIFYKLGNHCMRFEHYIMHKAPELLGIQAIELTSLLRLKERGIELIKDKIIAKANGLNIIHGHEFGGSVCSPVNIARGLYLKGKASAIQGHNHQVSEHTEPDMNGNITTTWSVGCLCELHPAYLPINKWAHGAAIVTLDKNGKTFNVQ